MASKNIAVVTGAGSGFGKEFVKLLLEEPELEEIWCVARNEEKLLRLKEVYGDKIRPFSADLSSLSDMLGFAKTLDAELPNILWLINNAGYAKFCSYSDLSIEESVNMIELNCGAVAAMAVAAIPHMKSGAHILNIASQASFQPLPYQNIYSATKAFVRSYSRALNVELKDKGIIATTVCPGWMETELYDRAQIGAKKATKNFVGMTPPGKVAKKAVNDAKRGKDISVYGAYVKSCHLLAKLLPQRAMMKIWLFQQKIDPKKSDPRQKNA